MGGRRLLHDLVVLDQRVGEQPLAHLGQLRGILDIELDQPADVDVRHAGETERRERALHGLTLRIEDARLRPDEHSRPHQALVRSSHSPNGSPVIRSYASTYFSRVRATTSSGI